MRNECNIIRDILPLYAENMVSPDTADFVGEHLRSCEACRREYEQSKDCRPTREISDAAPLLKLGRKMKLKKIQTVAMTAVFVIALLISAFAVLDAPVYFPYSEELITVEQLGDKQMIIAFDEEVTDFDLTHYDNSDGNFCCIQAWTSLWDKLASLWDKWFSQEKREPAVIFSSGAPIIVLYIPNDGNENVCIAKYDPNAENLIEKNADYESTISLPRLSLGYYLILAAAALTVLVIIWIIVRKKAKLRIWVERIGLYPVAYIISNCIVSGFNTSTCSLTRDFFLIIFISIILYSGLLLAHNVWRLKKEIKEINR